MRWYLDCFSLAPSSRRMLGDLFPLNTYYSDDVEKLAIAGAKLLMRENSGIDKITISQETKGQSPCELDP